MKSRVVLALCSISLFVAVGCFQSLDNGVIAGGAIENSTDTGPVDASQAKQDGSPVTGNSSGALPAPYADADLTQQCAPGSDLCFELCGSPECATQLTSPDGATSVVLNPTLQSVPTILPDGSTTDPCTALEAASMEVRQRSCGGCHGASPAPGFAGFNYVLDDATLVGHKSQGGTQTMVIAGDPNNSYVYQRMQAGVADPTSHAGMPPNPCSASGASPTVCKELIYPSPEDLSIMYGWILNCAGGQDGGALGATFYGGNYGPGGDSGTPGTDSGGPGPGGDSGRPQSAGGADAGLPTGSGVITDAGGRG